ncbi:sugar phosphate isomerase/epimerase [Devosia sp.]|uniref:sugar phosphate isomerase/epimerase family protein n=1 Tax=Devosia sp. TaxID=1871048 RepID=UPI002AFEB297|nr:sugar phosphate isomerase/epimerase [Devosia sp.]
MLIGNAPCSWGIAYPTGNRYGWEQYLDEVAAAGYRGTELGPFGYFPKDAARLRDELAKRDLTLIGATHVHTLGDAASAGAFLATLDDLSRLLVELGARHLVIMDESNFYPAGREGVLDEEGWRGLVVMVRAAQARVEGEHGLKLSFHPHVGTAVEREAQIDRLLGETDIDLCFDTGHHAFWGQDPLAYMEKVFPRIAYMHLKNVDPGVRARVLGGELSIAASYGEGVMCPLPDGAVDIRAVMALLAARHFSGPVVVEQDVAANASETPLQLAARNLAFMRDISA